MARTTFFRNRRAADRLELFLVSAVATVLLIRLYLQLTNYPQLGNAQLHIAHMLFGGLLMLVAITILLSFLGSRARRLSAFLGGVGFGFFIDELGKFITKDNNYFFQPTIALIYLVFIAIFLTFRALSQQRELTDNEKLLNALSLLEDAILHDMDGAEKQQALAMLNSAEPDDPLAANLAAVVSQIEPVPQSEHTLEHRIRTWLDTNYRRIIERPITIKIITALFLVQAFLYMIVIVVAIGLAISGQAQSLYFDIRADASPAAIAQLITSLVAASLVVAGAFAIRKSRARGYELFMQAVLVTLFFTEFFAFYRDQFGALPEVIYNLLLFLILRYAIREERRQEVLQK